MDIAISLKNQWEALPRSLRGALCVVAGCVIARRLLKIHKRRAIRNERDAMNKQDVVYLYTFPPWARGVTYSPFCLKVMAFMRLAHIPYVAIYTRDLGVTPTGRLPCIVLNGEVTCESSFIIERLKKHFKVDPDSWLSPEQHATALATQRMLEDNMAWGFDRFLFVDQYKPIVDVFSSEMKCPKCVACWAFRRTIRKRFIHVLNTQGNGDLTDEQYHAELLQDVIAFETILGGKPFLMGDKPTSYDCAALGQLHTAIMMPEVSCVALDHARKHHRIVAYVHRLTELLFPDEGKVVKERHTGRTHEFL